MPDAASGCIPGLLADADPDVRLLACELARDLPTAEAAALLGRLLATETRTECLRRGHRGAGRDRRSGTRCLLLAQCAARFPTIPF